MRSKAVYGALMKQESGANYGNYENGIRVVCRLQGDVQVDSLLSGVSNGLWAVVRAVAATVYDSARIKSIMLNRTLVCSSTPMAPCAKRSPHPKSPQRTARYLKRGRASPASVRRL